MTENNRVIIPKDKKDKVLNDLNEPVGLRLERDSQGEHFKFYFPPQYTEKVIKEDGSESQSLFDYKDDIIKLLRIIDKFRDNDSFDGNGKENFLPIYSCLWVINDYITNVKERTVAILNTSACVLKNAPEVIAELKPYEKYMHGYRKNIFQELEYQASQYPDKKLSEIIQIPELAEKYVINTYYEAMDFAKKRDSHMGKADDMILKTNPGLQKPLQELHTNVYLAYGNDDDKRVSYLVQEFYRKFLDEHGLDSIKNDVMDEIKQIPLLSFTKNSFLSYARRYYSDGMLLQYLIRPFMETIKSIIPMARGGSNDVNNKIIVCRTCGNDLAQFPYNETVKYHPEMTENIEKQLQFYADKIIKGVLPAELYDYPIAVAKTLYEDSNGIINPDLSKYIDKLKEIKP